MTKTLLFLLTICLTTQAYSQVINFQLGGSLSNLNWSVADIPGRASLVNVDETVYEEYIIGPSMFFGLDYLNHKYYNLSSNIGYIQKGGRYTEDRILYILDEKAQLHYLSFNTCVDVKLPLKESTHAFLRFGPRIDFLASTKGSIITNLSGPNTGEIKDLMYGLMVGAGVKHDLNKLQIGLRFDYYLNLTNIAQYTYSRKYAVLGYGEGTLQDNSFVFSVVLGYHLR
tara:strand:+ start:1030 stop:1710 length:681 start_codon:yes stop_codon:yes gene_type:complete